MRFCLIYILILRARLFDLFTRMGLQSKLRDYYLDGVNCPSRYNGITRVKKEYCVNESAQSTTQLGYSAGRGSPVPLEEDPFHVSERNGGPVPNQSVISSFQKNNEGPNP